MGGKQFYWIKYYWIVSLKKNERKNPYNSQSWKYILKLYAVPDLERSFKRSLWTMVPACTILSTCWMNQNWPRKTTVLALGPLYSHLHASLQVKSGILNIYLNILEIGFYSNCQIIPDWILGGFTKL